MQSYSAAGRQKKRIGWLIFGLAGLLAILFVRLFYLQVARHQHFLVLASKSHFRKYALPAERGEIFIKDGSAASSPLALNQTLNLLYADPSFVQDKSKTAAALAKLTGQKAADLERLLGQSSEYVVLKTRLDRATAEQIQALRLPGIGTTAKQYRVYPEGSLASQLLGFVNAEDKGQYGVEGYMDAILGGKPGLLSGKTDVLGAPIATADNTVVEPVAGSDIYLTIDRSIQAQAEKYLKQGVESTGATSGSVVVIDPQTGAIRAMANYPTYDPNDFQKVKDYSRFGNAVTGDQFEPGSGFKLITMAAGLNTKKVKPSTMYDDTGSVQLSGYTISNAANHKFGRQNMLEVIQKSLNTGVIFVLKRLGAQPDQLNKSDKQVFYDYITKHFGFGKPTGVEQPQEVGGVVNPPTSNDVNYANMTFGQGLSTSVLQMTTAVAAIANGGKLYKPYLVERVVGKDGVERKTAPQVINPRVISKQTAKELTTMMTAAVEHGSGYAAKMPGYKVAGKTGTAQIPRRDGRGYVADRNIGTFVGMAPAEQPRFVMMVRINEPRVSGFAESTTVPVFANIASWLLRYYAVPPSA